MKPNDLPLVCLPLGLCDDDVATLLQFLYDLTEALESHYGGELRRRNHQQRIRSDDSPFADPNPTDPPF
jgi:Rps23 Pro-64 3,4-dihydroxylase Tpa1-like proline 4-hydroxylase